MERNWKIDIIHKTKIERGKIGVKKDIDHKREREWGN